MSIESWKKEFYPVLADSACKTDLQALRHTLKKYHGLRPENIKKHNLTHRYNVIRDSRDIFLFTGSSCALCRKYSSFCKSCPIRKSEGGSCSEKENGAYIKLMNDSDPEPMILLMEKLIKKEIKKNKRKRAKK